MGTTAQQVTEWETFEGITYGRNEAGHTLVTVTPMYDVWRWGTCHRERAWTATLKNGELVHGTASDLRIAKRDAAAAIAADTTMTPEEADQLRGAEITYSDGADVTTTVHSDPADAELIEGGEGDPFDMHTGMGSDTAESLNAEALAEVETEERAERRRSYYAMRRPVLEDSFPDNVVTQGDADYCRDFGHAFHTIDGVDTGRCPRCGELTASADVTSDTDGPEVKAGQTWGHDVYSTRHHIVGPADAAGMWEARGPLGHLYVIGEAELKRHYRLMTDDTDDAETDEGILSERRARAARGQIGWADDESGETGAGAAMGVFAIVVGLMVWLGPSWVEAFLSAL